MMILDPMIYEFQPQVRTPDPKFFERHMEVSLWNVQQATSGCPP